MNKNRHSGGISYAGGSLKAVSSKKRKRSDEGISELVEQIGNFRAACCVASQKIGEIATFFEKESEKREKRQGLFNALSKLDGFTTQELLNVYDAMWKEPHNIDVFMELPGDVRRQFVWKKLGEFDVYPPPFGP